MENETHHETIVREFTKQAVPFAEHPAHSQEETLAGIRTIANLGQTDQVLDSGCTPGLVSCYLAGFVRHITGVVGKLRDPSHASALTIEELVELGERHTLTPVKVHRLRLRIELGPHLTKSLSTPTVADKLRELVQSDT